MKNLTKNIIAASVALILIGATAATTTAICHEQAKRSAYETETVEGYFHAVVELDYNDKIDRYETLKGDKLLVIGDKNYYIFALEEPRMWHFEWVLKDYYKR